MIDSLALFKSSFKELPLVADSSWCENIATWVDDRVTNKAELSGITTANKPFTFNKSVFKTQLQSISNTNSNSVAASNFANAWEEAINSSTLVVNPNDYIGSSTPGTTWSIVNSCVINTGSIQDGKQIIIDGLTNAQPVANTDDSTFFVVFRNAFLALKGDIMGIDSSVPTPSPLNVSGVSFI